MGDCSAIDRKGFARRLRETRRALDMSQKHVAEAAGLDRSQVSKYERGEHVPSADALRSLARALKTTTDHLLGGPTQPPSAAPGPHPALPRLT